MHTAAVLFVLVPPDDVVLVDAVLGAFAAAVAVAAASHVAAVLEVAASPTYDSERPGDI